MSESAYEEYGIQYNRYKVRENAYLLIPSKLVVGYNVGGSFYCNGKKPLQVADDIEAIKSNKILIDGVMTAEDLMEYYRYEDKDFVKDYYLQEELDYAIFLSIKDGQICKKKIKVEELQNKHESEIYEMLAEDPVVTLSDRKLDTLLSIEDIEVLKRELQAYRDKLETFKKLGGTALSKLVITDGKITRIETNGHFYINVNDPQYREIKNYYSDTEPAYIDDSSFPEDKIDYQPTGLSVRGLYDYLRERVIGHEKELKKIATVLIRNTRLRQGRKTRNILIPGPTGTGKTLTFECAAEYMGLPFVFVNVANLVPQGIVGSSVEDAFISLIHKCDGDIARAKRSIVVFDEFDKLETTGLDLKQSIKPIFLKITEGSEVTLVERDGFGYENHTFDTSLLNKAYLGAFSECFQSPKTMGFNATPTEEQAKKVLFSKKRMYECGYYDRELITRMPIVVPYYELTFEEMKQALFCKSSELLKEIDDLKRDFGIEIEGIDEFALGLLDLLTKEDTSMRDLNNLVINAFTDIEFELEDNPDSYHRLVLSRETASDSTKFDLS